MNHFIISIKYFLLGTFIVSSSFLNCALLVSAQESDTGESAQTTIVSDIYLAEPFFENKIYKKGDTVQVTLPITNNDLIDYPEMTFSAQISVFTKDGQVKKYGRQDNLVEFFLPKESTKNVTFNYKMPNSISSSEDDTVRIEVQVLQKTGELFGNTANFIEVEHVQVPFELSLAAVNVGEKFYTLQEGPIANSDEVVQITALFLNAKKETITLYPKLKVYDLDPSRPVLETKDYEPINLIESSDYQTFVFDMPRMSKPGVYASELSFFDAAGVEQTDFVAARWIIDGDMATISRVSLDKNTLKKREEILIDIEYSGAPQNIDTGEIRQVGRGMMSVTLYNEKNEVIGFQEQEVDFSTLRGSAQFAIMATGNAKTIIAYVVASKNGQELASYKTNVSNPEAQKANPVIEILSLIAIIIILLVVVFVYKKIISKKIIITGFLIILFLGIGRGVDAYAVTISNDLIAYTNLTRTNFTVGEYMGWNVPIQVNAYACRNQGGFTEASWSIDGTSLSGNANNSYSVTAAANAVFVALAKCAGQRGCTNDWIHGEEWRLIDAFYPNNMYAPSTPGTYTLRIKVWNTARFKDANSGGKAIKKGPATFTHTFTVSCPAGQNWNGWGCVTPVSGSCGSTIWSCNAGGADSGNSDTSNAWWRCAGSGGGSDAWCSVPLAPPPTNISTQCSPAGNAVAMYWTNQPGYDRVYFRNHDNSAGAYYGYNDDYQNNWAYLTGITPGHSYNWWIHTRRWDGLWSNPVGEGYVCTAQQPSNLNVSCSADGRIATFSWTNPGAYNRVYFRNHDYTGGYDVAYGDNNDVWGNTYTVYGITPGNNYGWWIHTRDAVGNYGPAVSGSFTCSAAPVDQCTNVGGVQATIPASATKNADGTCSCSAGKHFEGAVCVDNTTTPTFTVSCSSSPNPVVFPTKTTTFTAVTSASSPIAYTWKNLAGTTLGNGATLIRTYGDGDNNLHTLTLDVTKGAETNSATCSVLVKCNSDHNEDDPASSCDPVTNTQTFYTCKSSGWSTVLRGCTPPVVTTGLNPEVSTFNFTPDIVADPSGKCGISLSATNVSSCTLTAPGATPVQILGVSGVISKSNEKIIPVGRYNLSCTGLGATPVTKQFGFKTCSLNADVRER